MIHTQTHHIDTKPHASKSSDFNAGVVTGKAIANRSIDSPKQPRRRPREGQAPQPAVPHTCDTTQHNTLYFTTHTPYHNTTHLPHTPSHTPYHPTQLPHHTRHTPHINHTPYHTTHTPYTIPTTHTSYHIYHTRPKNHTTQSPYHTALIPHNTIPHSTHTTRDEKTEALRIDGAILLRYATKMEEAVR